MYSLCHKWNFICTNVFSLKRNMFIKNTEVCRHSLKSGPETHDSRPWDPEIRDPETLELWDPGTMRPWDPGPWDSKTQDRRTLRSRTQGHWDSRLWDTGPWESRTWGSRTLRHKTLTPRTLELGPWHSQSQNWVYGTWDLQPWDRESWEQDPENWTCDTDS